MYSADRSFEPWVFLAPVAGVWTAFMVLRARRRARRSRSWPVTQGVVVESKLLRGGKGGDQAIIVYSYFTSEPRTGDGLGPGGRLVPDPAGMVQRFPAGKEVDVRYDPANPADSFLDTGAQVQLPELTVLAILGISFPFLYLLWTYLWQ